MIYSDECYLKDICSKLKKDESCSTNSIYCPKLFKMDMLYNKSLLSAKQRLNVALVPNTQNDLNCFDRLDFIGKNIFDFVNSGGNLYICSSTPGNGKTSWAIKLMQKYFGEIWASTADECRGIFINVPWFLLSLKEDISKKSEEFAVIKESIMDADLVIWDDIATKLATEFEQENLLSFIDHRIAEGKSNIFTSNALPQELGTIMGKRLASRVAEQSECLTFNGGDRRGEVKWQ